MKLACAFAGALALGGCDPLNSWIKEVCSGGGNSCYQPWGTPTENVGQWAGASIVNDSTRRNNFAAVILGPERAVPGADAADTIQIGFGGSISAQNPLTKKIVDLAANAGAEFTKETRLVVTGAKTQEIFQVIPVALCPSPRIELVSAQLTTGNICNARMTNVSGRVGVAANLSLADAFLASNGTSARPQAPSTPSTAAAALDATRPTCPPQPVQSATSLRNNSELKVSPVAVGNPGEGIANAQLGAQFVALSSSIEQGANLLVGFKRTSFDCTASIYAPVIKAPRDVGPYSVVAPDDSLEMEVLDSFLEDDGTRWLRLNILLSLGATGKSIAELDRLARIAESRPAESIVPATVAPLQAATRQVEGSRTSAGRREALLQYDAALRAYEQRVRRPPPIEVRERAEIEKFKREAPSCNDYVNFGLASNDPSSRLGVCKLKVGEFFGVPDRAGGTLHSGWVVLIQSSQISGELDFRLARVEYREASR